MGLDLHEEEHTGNTNSNHTGAFSTLYPLGRHLAHSIYTVALPTAVRQLPVVICISSATYLSSLPSVSVLLCVSMC